MAGLAESARVSAFRVVPSVAGRPVGSFINAYDAVAAGQEDPSAEALGYLRDMRSGGSWFRDCWKSPANHHEAGRRWPTACHVGGPGRTARRVVQDRET